MAHLPPSRPRPVFWTTADDLARFAIELQKALQGESEMLPEVLAARMVPHELDRPQLGFDGMASRGGHVYFHHGGWNAGFSSRLIAHRDEGYGAVVMLNSNQPRLVDELLQWIAVEYGWGGVKTYEKRPIPESALRLCPGRYRLNGEKPLIVRHRKRRLFTEIAGHEDFELVCVGDSGYVRRDQEEL